MSVQLPPAGHKHWLQKEGAKLSTKIPNGFGWISSGWSPDGNFYNYYISDKDLDAKNWRNAVYVKS